MKQRLINLEETTAALKPYLGQYLQEQGLDISQNFKCINPDHDDDTPSMTCKQYPETAFCFACNIVCDIFTAAHFLEDKPAKGIGWIEDNVMYLANKFGVPVKLEDFTPEEIYEYRTYDAYAMASQLISDPNFGDYTLANKEIERRGWDKEKLTNWGIGTVNYSEFKDRLKKVGYEVKFLSGIGLDMSNLFDNSYLLFTVYDDMGRPVGFSAKNLKYGNGDSNSSKKYINTRTTGLECAIFKKGERLYGLELAKEIVAPLHIFEGQANVVTARHHGMINCVATMGTAFTDHHINLLKKYGKFNIVLVYDGDKAGYDAAQRALDDKFAKEKDFRVKLCQMPDGKDPDELIREFGIDELIRLKKWSAFEWRMKNFMEEIGDSEELDDERKREIAEKMTPIIVSEPSHIRQEEMSRQVSKMTGYNLATIVSEVKRLRDVKEAQIQTKKRGVIEALVHKVKYNPDEAEEALYQATRNIEDINKTLQDEDKTGSKTLDLVLTQKETDENKSTEFAGFFMKPYGLAGLGARLNDDWRKDRLIFIGGSEQAGKSSLCAQMAYEISDDVRNNAICIYFSIDDSARFILYKWVCNATNDRRLQLSHVSSPNYWINLGGYSYIPKLRDRGYQKIINMIKDEKLILKDTVDGQDLIYAKSLVGYYRSKFPDQNIVLFIDSFHKLSDYGNIQGHERAKRICNELKRICTSEHVTIVSTAEYRKLQKEERPSNVCLAESRALQYDADVIIHMYNDLHHKGEHEAEVIHRSDNGEIMPRIWCKFGKNKVSGYEGVDYLDLYGGSAALCAVDNDVVKREWEQHKEYIKTTPTMKF